MTSSPHNINNDNNPPYAYNESHLNGSLEVTTEAKFGKDTKRSLADLLWIYAAPIIFAIGVSGNIFVLLVMRRRRMSGTTTSVYLRLMAVADLCVLVGMIPEWVEAMYDFEFKELSPVTCKLEKFVLYTVSDTAIWILVVFSLDRFHALVFPFSKLEICQPNRAKFNALGVFVCACLKNLHVFWTRGAMYRKEGNETIFIENCGMPTEAYAYFEKYIRPWIIFALVNALPFCILLFCNVFIIRVLVSVRRMQNHQAVVTSKDKTLIQMSLMCLSASFCFLVCMTPTIILLIGKPYWSKNDSYWVAKAINNQLTYVNHSANFFLYCLTGKRFRRELIAVLRCQSTSQGSPLGSTDSKSYVYRFNTNKSPTRSPKNEHNRTFNGNVRYYKMDHGTGKIAPDHSPDNLNLSLLSSSQTKISPP